LPQYRSRDDSDCFTFSLEKVNRPIIVFTKAGLTQKVSANQQQMANPKKLRSTNR